jgi:dipeptidyl aminopeptidase/acylaminoacyl peptidase
MKELLVLLLILFCCQSYAQVNDGNSYTVINDIQYYNGPGYDTVNQKLNLVIPNGVEQPPLLVWIGGGAWSYVSRDVEMDIAKKIAENGIAVASVSHRLSPATWKDSSLNTGIKHPQHIKDVARAISFLNTKHSKYGYSEKKIFVGGFSSGGHLAALIVMDGQFLKEVGLSTKLIQGVIPIAGTYDIAHYYQVLTEGNGKDFADNHVGSVFGLSIKEFEQGSPTNYIDSLSTPMLLISETNTFKYTNLFEDRLREINYKELEVLHIHRLGHGALWKELSYSPHSRYRNIIIDFIKRNSDNIGQKNN